jgi:hypothetical protein
VELLVENCGIQIVTYIPFNFYERLKTVAKNETLFEYAERSLWNEFLLIIA